MTENEYIRSEIGDSAMYLFRDGLVAMVEKNEGFSRGTWAHPETDAPAFVRKVLGLNYAPEPGTVTVCFSFAPKIRFVPVTVRRN